MAGFAFRSQPSSEPRGVRRVRAPIGTAGWPSHPAVATLGMTDSVKVQISLVPTAQHEYGTVQLSRCAPRCGPALGAGGEGLALGARREIRMCRALPRHCLATASGRGEARRCWSRHARGAPRPPSEGAEPGRALRHDASSPVGHQAAPANRHASVGRGISYESIKCTFTRKNKRHKSIYSYALNSFKFSCEELM